MSLVVRHGRKDAKLGVHVLVDRHDGRHVAAPVAVVGRRPDGDDGFFGEMELPGGKKVASVMSVEFVS